MKHLITRLEADHGASMVEYALLVTLIAMVAIVAVQFFGTEVSGAFQTTANTFP